MAELPRIQSFSEFWPYYLGEHRHPLSRVLHYVGTIASWGALLAGILVSPWLLIAIPFVGYGPAWIGHFLIEKNKPATFGYPLWSIRGDYKMFGLAMTGRLSAEMARVLPAASNADNAHVPA